MSQFSFVIHPEAFERFSRDAFAGTVGKVLDVVAPDGVRHSGTLIAATVADDGESVELTIDSEFAPR